MEQFEDITIPSTPVTPSALTEEDKQAIADVVVAKLKAESIDTRTLENVPSLDGITSIPALRDTDIVAVPLDLLGNGDDGENVKICEIQDESDLATLDAQGLIDDNTLYYISE